MLDHILAIHKHLRKADEDFTDEFDGCQTIRTRRVRELGGKTGKQQGKRYVLSTLAPDCSIWRNSDSILTHAFRQACGQPHRSSATDASDGHSWWVRLDTWRWVSRRKSWKTEQYLHEKQYPSYPVAVD